MAGGMLVAWLLLAPGAEALPVVGRHCSSRTIRSQGPHRHQLLFLLFMLLRAAERVVFQGLRQKLGFGRTRWVASGGGSLTPQTDDFYEAIGVPVVVGYGLTETSPVMTIRHLDCNVRGTIGPRVPSQASALRIRATRLRKCQTGSRV
ncbi:hypothetical protein ABPG77_000154 [Micractinium sp. CCAP 211/92]